MRKILNASLEKFIYPLMFIYILFSIFETYINATVGHISRYFMLGFSAVAVLSYVTNRKMKRVSKDQFFVLLWYIYSLFSVLWSTNMEQASKYLFTFVTMGAVLFTAYSIEFSFRQKEKLLAFYQLCSFVLCVLGVFYSAELNANNHMRYVLYLGGTRMDPNYLLSLYIISVQISIYKLLNRNEHRILNLIVIAVGVYVILMTGSRSGIVMLGLSVMLIGFGKLRTISTKQKISLLVFTALLLIVALYVLKRIMPEATFNRILGKGMYAYSNSTGRIKWWKDDFAEWKGIFNICFGMGFGSNTTHSTWLSFLMEFGIFGFGLFLIPNINLVIKLFKTKNMLALAFYAAGMFQAFMCPATNMRFFWNALIFPVILCDSLDRGETNKGLVCMDS